MGLAVDVPKLRTPDQEALVIRQSTLIHKTPSLFRYGELDRLPGKSRNGKFQGVSKSLFRLEPQTSTPSVIFGDAVLLVQP